MKIESVEQADSTRNAGLTTELTGGPATLPEPTTSPERYARVRKGTKVPPDRRKQRRTQIPGMLLHKRILSRLMQDSQALRSTVQLAFVLLCVWIGIEFSFFMRWGLSGGGESFVPRPPGAEGFLPISALISLKSWLQTGIINTIHPAALFIFLAIIGVSLAAKKAFCSWLCPIGTLSESLWMLGGNLLGRNVTVPRWLDYPLRSLKYLLLLFFGWSVWNMGADGLSAFIGSPYNRVADIKMYLFFARMSLVALVAIALLIVLSVVIKSFWCRYLCPYGALLGVTSWLSPLKITRTPERCVDCELCTRVCPANIEVHTAKRVWSDECTSCLACVQACPVKDALEVRLHARSAPVPQWAVGVLVVGVFIGMSGLAMLTGHWSNTISKSEYLRRFQELDTPVYQHFRGEVPRYGPND